MKRDRPDAVSNAESSLRRELYAQIAEVGFGPKGLMHLKGDLKEDLRQLLLVDSIRTKLCQARLEQATLNRKFRTLAVDAQKHRTMDSGRTTIEHNLEGVYNDLSSARSSRIIKPLSCLERFRPLAVNQRPEAVIRDINCEVSIPLLCIGPRTEAEIFLLWANGFHLESIEAIDLISYSPLIRLGDMHNLPYHDNQFECVLCSCTIVYSADIKLAVQEIKRVLKPKGVIAIMIDVACRDYKHESVNLFGVELFDPRSISNLFYGESTKVYYQHFEESNLGQPNGCSSVCIFREEDAET